MKENRKWAQYFGIKNTLPLEKVLNRSIPEEEYLKWASVEYRLPVLREDYFDLIPSSQIWSQFKDVMDWNSAVVPLEEWEGFLYVGCLEPQPSPLNQKVIFVLASSKKLEAIWNFYSSNTFQSQEDQKLETSLSDHKIGILKETPKEDSSKNNLSLEELPILGVKKDSDSEKKDESQKEVNREDSTKSHLDLEDSPLLRVEKDKSQKKENDDKKVSEQQKIKEALKEDSDEEPCLKIQSISKNLDFKEKSSQKKKPSENLSSQSEDKNKTLQDFSSQMDSDDFMLNEPSNSSWDRFVEFIIQLLFTPIHKPSFPKKTKLSKFKKRISNKKQTPSFQKEAELKETVPTSQSPSSQKTKIEEKKQQGDLKNTSSAVQVDEVQTSEKKIKSSVQITTQKGQLKPVVKFENDSDSEESSKKTSEKKQTSFNSLDTQTEVFVENLQSPVRSILEESKKYVRSYILFRFTDKKFLPIKWSHDLKPKKIKPIPINHSSFLRVSYHSKQPYFGFVPPVLGNQDFFENWNFETLPDQIAFIPFVNKGKKKILGGFLGILEEVDSSLNCLHSMESLLKPLEEYYQGRDLEKKSVA